MERLWRDRHVNAVTQYNGRNIITHGSTLKKRVWLSLLCGVIFSIVFYFWYLNSRPWSSWRELRDEAEHRNKLALFILERAATLGILEAQVTLGRPCPLRTDSDCREPLSLDDEVYWRKRAAEQGDAEMQYQLGLTYLSHGGADKSEARKWFLMSANQGFERAWLQVGDNYYAAKDYADAYFWYSLAVSVGYPNAPAVRDTVTHLTLAEKTAIDTRVAQWLKTHPIQRK